MWKNRRSLISVNVPSSLVLTGETEKTIDQLQTGKAPGAEWIPPEIYKMGGLALVVHLTGIFHSFWRKGELPQDLKDANIMYLYKNKGDKSVCDNHRGISLLSQARSSLESSWTGLLSTWLTVWSSRVSVGSGRTEAPLIWFLQSDSYKRNVSNSIMICTCYSLTSPRLLTQLVDRACGPSLLN